MLTNYIDPLYIEKFSTSSAISFDSGTVTVHDTGVELDADVGIRATTALQAIPIQGVSFRTTFSVANFINADLVVRLKQNGNNFEYILTDADLDSGEVSLTLNQFFLQYTTTPLNPIDGDVFFEYAYVNSTYIYGEYVTWGPTGNDWFEEEVTRSDGELTFHYLYLEVAACVLVWTSYIGTTEECL